MGKNDSRSVVQQTLLDYFSGVDTGTINSTLEQISSFNESILVVQHQHKKTLSLIMR